MSRRVVRSQASARRVQRMVLNKPKNNDKTLRVQPT